MTIGISREQISQGKRFILSWKVGENEFCKVLGTMWWTPVLKHWVTTGSPLWNSLTTWTFWRLPLPCWWQQCLRRMQPTYWQLWRPISGVSCLAMGLRSALLVACLPTCLCPVVPWCRYYYMGVLMWNWMMYVYDDTGSAIRCSVILVPVLSRWMKSFFSTEPAETLSTRSALTTLTGVSVAPMAPSTDKVSSHTLMHGQQVTARSLKNHDENYELRSGRFQKWSLVLSKSKRWCPYLVMDLRSQLGPWICLDALMSSWFLSVLSSSAGKYWSLEWKSLNMMSN